MSDAGSRVRHRKGDLWHGLLVLMAVMIGASGCSWASVVAQRVPVRRPPSPQFVVVGRFAGPLPLALSCVPGSRLAPTVTMLTRGRPHTWHCTAWRVQGPAPGGLATWFEMAGGFVRAVPAGGAPGAGVRPLWAPGLPERFRRARIWVQGTRLRVTAKLAGSLATGSYRFTVQARPVLSMAVTARLIFRHSPGAASGLPALVTRYDYGVANHMPAQAVYLARHASDGLWVAGPKARYWVPLRNPRAPLLWMPVTAVVSRFGLLQRNRRRRDFGPVATRYPDAPDVEARLVGIRGHVRLRERPWRAQGQAWKTVWGHGNVVALFTPIVRPSIGRPWVERYRLIWSWHRRRSRRLVVVQTLIGGTFRTGARKYVIDYARGVLPLTLPHNAIRGHVRVRPFSFVTQNTWRFNPYTRGWRQVVQVLPVPGRTLHVRAWLTRGTHLISEVWAYDILAPRISH